MSQSEIYERLTKVFDTVLDRQVVLGPLTSAADVDGWDSFAHVDLTLAIETEFGLRFTTAELEKMLTVGDMVAFIEKKTA